MDKDLDILIDYIIERQKEEMERLKLIVEKLKLAKYYCDQDNIITNISKTDESNPNCEKENYI